MNKQCDRGFTVSSSLLFAFCCVGFSFFALLPAVNIPERQELFFLCSLKCLREIAL